MLKKEIFKIYHTLIAEGIVDVKNINQFRKKELVAETREGLNYKYDHFWESKLKKRVSYFINKKDKEGLNLPAEKELIDLHSQLIDFYVQINPWADKNDFIINYMEANPWADKADYVDQYFSGQKNDFLIKKLRNLMGLIVGFVCDVMGRLERALK